MKILRFWVIEPLCTAVWIAHCTWVPSHVSGRLWSKMGPLPSWDFHLPRGTPVSNFPEVIRTSLGSNILKAICGLKVADQDLNPGLSF